MDSSLTPTSLSCLLEVSAVLTRNLVVSAHALRVVETSPILCMRECATLKLCRSVNIYQNSLRCEMVLQNSTGESGNTVTSSDGMAIDAKDIPKEYAATCFDHNCLIFEKCVVRRSGGYVCIPFDFCDEQPASIMHAKFTIDRSGGIPIADYSCVEWANYTSGDKNSSCNPATRTWSVPGIVCKPTFPEACGTPPLLSVPHDVTYPYDGDNFLANYECPSLSGDVAATHCPITVCIGVELWTNFSLSCSVKDCYTSNGVYDGQIACTVTGRTCQRWDTQSPHAHLYFITKSDNYCRIASTEQPWCFTTDPSTRWEHCAVPRC
ncbi:plasminogen-like [Ylistrum balloti]|uniref:plasminogen-like n=1 Tax=Ylistrum balloti TaxID=509963 RepID=UPI002905B224|nr:plasminogen-like [Ylistrum balloti]